MMPFRYFVIIGLLLYIAYVMKKNEERQKDVEKKIGGLTDKVEQEMSAP